MDTFRPCSYLTRDEIVHLKADITDICPRLGSCFSFYGHLSTRTINMFASNLFLFFVELIGNWLQPVGLEVNREALSYFTKFNSSSFSMFLLRDETTEFAVCLYVLQERSFHASIYESIILFITANLSVLKHFISWTSSFLTTSISNFQQTFRVGRAYQTSNREFNNHKIIWTVNEIKMHLQNVRNHRFPTTQVRSQASKIQLVFHYLATVSFSKLTSTNFHLEMFLDQKF